MASTNIGPFVKRATILAGAVPFKAANVNDTYRGQVLLEDQSISSAIIKDLDQRQLANELFAAALADALNLPVPKAYLAAAQPQTLPAKKGPTLPNGTRLVFASTYTHVPAVAQLYLGSGAAAVREKLAEWEKIGALYAFDSWIANIDRHEGNLLFDGDNHVWLIDHGHCFSGPQWQAANLLAAHDYNNRLKDWLTPVISTPRRAALAADAAKYETPIGALNPSAVGDTNGVKDFLLEGDFNALISFLDKRSSQVPRLAALALNINTMV